MPLIGPNCYGLLNYLNGAMLWPDQQGGLRVDEGVAIITMSSNVGFNLTMQRRGLPIAYMLSLGNKLKFDLHDAISIFSEIPEVTAIGLFVESISSPAQLEQAEKELRAAIEIQCIDCHGTAEQTLVEKVDDQIRSGQPVRLPTSGPAAPVTPLTFTTKTPA